MRPAWALSYGCKSRPKEVILIEPRGQEGRVLTLSEISDVLSEHMATIWSRRVSSGTPAALSLPATDWVDEESCRDRIAIRDRRAMIRVMFAEAIARMRAVTIGEADDGCEHVEIEPAATPEQRARIASLFGGVVPSELDGLLAVTTGFDGDHPSMGTAALELDPAGMHFVERAGFGPLVRVYDYGNGDGMYLEPSEPTCRLWWVGEDSWPIALVARSLAEYVERCVAFLESVSDEDTVGDCACPYEPRFELSPRSRAEALDGEEDPAAHALLSAASDDALVYDFRNCELPIEIDLSVGDESRVDLDQARRHGELVVVPTRAPARNFVAPTKEQAGEVGSEPALAQESPDNREATLKPATDLACMLQCLLMVRVKAEACFRPATGPEQLAEDEATFASISHAVQQSGWARMFEREMDLGTFNFLADPAPLRPNSTALMNWYWLAEGIVPLAWLLGILRLPTIEEPGDFEAVYGGVPVPHVNVAEAEAFLSTARVVVEPTLAAAILDRLEVTRNERMDALKALIDRLQERALKARREDQQTLQIETSRSIERVRMLSWALGRPLSIKSLWS